jgi:hypothetical protein
MVSVAKKRLPPTPPGEEETAQAPFRAERRLFDALDAYARSIRRSRNMAMVLLLEEALRRHGFWKPPAA